MLEILLKVLFFLSMLVVYAYVTSTSVVIVIVAIYVACVFSYYYFDNIQATIDQWSHYLNLEARFNDSINPSHLSAYFVNRKFNKMGNSNTTMSSASGKKIFNSSCNPDVPFAQENCPLEARGSSTIKTNGDLPSPIMKNSGRLSRDGLKLGFSTKSNSSRKNRPSGYVSVGPNHRYNTMDLETYMNVNSPGFTSRVVDKATESASYHIKYPAVRQIPAYRFDKSTLRQLSKIPKANFAGAIRIAPPELNNVEFPSTSSVINEPMNENYRNNDYLQVLRDISRKRNYSQEEMDRSITTPKKSRKNDAKNAISSQYKRAHEDCSNDSIDDQNCKKRCDDVDKNYAKMMSFTSSISVLVPEFSWSSSTKKRKSSRLEKSENESPEKIEKCRKIDEEPDEKSEVGEERSEESEVDSGKASKHEGVEMKAATNTEDVGKDTDETDSFLAHNMSNADENEEYVRVAGGKILNRTNCTYRKKLNSTKIDPVCVISTEPEYVSDTAYVDDKIMKENILNNLMNDIERKGEKDDKVIFYQNSIVEEIEKQSTAIEAQRINSSVLTSSSFNPLLPTTMTKPTISQDQPDSPAPSVIQLPQPIVSISNPINPPKIFNSEPSVEVSKTVLIKSPEKNKSVADVPSINFVASVPSASNTLFQPVASPSNNASQSKNPTSATAPQFNLPIPNSAKPSGNHFSPVFSGFSNGTSAPAVSNSGSKTDNATSSVPASSNSPLSFNPLEPQPKPAATNSLPPSAPVALISTPSSASSSPSLFTANSSAPSFSISNSAFTTSNSTTQNQETTFNFGAKSAPTFPQAGNANRNSSQMSVFNTEAASGAPAQQSVFGNISQPTNTQSNVFGAINQPSQTSTAPPSIFGTSSQASVVPAPSVFGVSPQPASTAVPTLTQSASQASIFGSIPQSTAASTAATFSSNVSTQSPAAVQPSVFGSTGMFQSQPSSQAQVPAFGSSGDLSSNVFGQSQSATPRVGVVNPLPQAAPQFGVSNAAPQQFGANSSSSRFTFGQPDAFGAQQNSAPSAFGPQQPAAPFGAQQTSAPAAFGSQQTSAPGAGSAPSMQSPFGVKPAAPPAGGAISSGTPQFNFSAPSPFGSGANTFNATSTSVPPAASGPFNFGASNPQPSQPAFQFGGTNPAPASNQPFMFGGNAAPVPNAGGFSIGSGGSSGRNRAMARPRKVK